MRALGVELSELGKFDEASACFRQALSADPRDGLAHRLLSELEEGEELAAHVEQMRALADDPAVGESALLELEFALGAALERLADYERAYTHYLRANAMRRKALSYDPSREREFFERLRAAFNPVIAQLCKGSGPREATPVFVVGMPRSGTTLVESLLAAHPHVQALGELTAFERALGDLSTVDASPHDHQKFLADLRAQFRRVGDAYLSAVDALGGRARVFVDKMPANFRFAVPIHLALPGARIVHIRRNRLDTCFSCFAVNFTESQTFAFDVDELVEYYAMYEEHMAFVRSVLPRGVLLEVDYEDVVNDTQRMARTIVAHCGLDWDERVLTERQSIARVRTASLRQVRRPVYASSIGRARRFPQFCAAATR